APRSDAARQEVTRRQDQRARRDTELRRNLTSQYHRRRVGRPATKPRRGATYTSSGDTQRIVMLRKRTIGRTLLLIIANIHTAPRVPAGPPNFPTFVYPRPQRALRSRPMRESPKSV